MTERQKLRVSGSSRVREARLAELLAGRRPEDLGLPETVRAAQVLGSLELAGLTSGFDEVLAVARGGAGPSQVVQLFEALRALPEEDPVTLEALEGWHRVLAVGRGFRQADREREPPPAPAGFIESRLRALLEWVNAEAIRELTPAQLGALAMARVIEVLPFDDGNGRVARLLASHLMVRAGSHPPILVKGDEPLLRASLAAAFRLSTEPLTALLDEASGRSLDVMIQSLAPPKGPSGSS